MSSSSVVLRATCPALGPIPSSSDSPAIPACALRNGWSSGPNKSTEMLTQHCMYMQLPLIFKDKCEQSLISSTSRLELSLTYWPLQHVYRWWSNSTVIQAHIAIHQWTKTCNSTHSSVRYIMTHRVTTSYAFFLCLNDCLENGKCQLILSGLRSIS